MNHECEKWMLDESGQYCRACGKDVDTAHPASKLVSNQIERENMDYAFTETITITPKREGEVLIDFGDGTTYLLGDENEAYGLLSRALALASDEDAELAPVSAAPTHKLSAPQERLLRQAQSIKPITHNDGSVTKPSLLVSGHEYRTAESLERLGYGTLRYQGPSMGWFAPNPLD